MSCNVAFIGLGVMGFPMAGYISKGGHNVTVYNRTASKADKWLSEYKGQKADTPAKAVAGADFIFICVPTLYNKINKKYDLSAIEEQLLFLNDNNYKNIVIIKSTIEPETCEKFKQKYNVKIVFNPEFLSARTANEDFHNQKHIVLGGDKIDVNKVEKFYNTYYSESKITKLSFTESECVKIFCNTFYSVKIQFFNELYLLCNKCKDCDFNKIRNAMILNDWINPMHTQVPGTDGKLSYGGKCFPKDTNALNEYLKRKGSLNSVIENTIIERNIMRE